MATCPKCGTFVEDSASFCPKCGAQLGAGNTGYNGSGYIEPSDDLSFDPRSIAVSIILSIVTCGIYGIFWFIKLVNETNEAAGLKNENSGGTVFLLSLVTCGIYAVIWYYKAGQKIIDAERMRRIPADSDSGLMYLLLSIFGLSIVADALIQSELNKIAAYHGKTSTK